MSHVYFMLFLTTVYKVQSITSSFKRNDHTEEVVYRRADPHISCTVQFMNLCSSSTMQVLLRYVLYTVSLSFVHASA